MKKQITKLQVDMDKIMFRRGKAIAAFEGKTLTNVMHELLENYVEQHEEKYLDEVFGQRLQKAREGKPVGDLPNVKTYYEMMEKAKK